MSIEHETFIEKSLSDDKARRSRSSGAHYKDPIDVTSEHLVIECESTRKKSYRFSKDLWIEARQKSFNDKRPMVAFRFDHPDPRHKFDLVAIELDFFKELMDAWIQKN